MDEYVKDTLREFQHTLPKLNYHGPSKADKPDCGAKMQYVKHSNTAPLSQKLMRHIQCIVGNYIFMGRAVDDTMLHILNNIACEVLKGTKAILAATTHFFNNIASYSTPRIRCSSASDMILFLESDTSYLVSLG